MVLNWDWNDLVNCSFCNVSISVRVLSPGDDGDIAQMNAVTSASVASVIDSLQQTLTQQTAAPAQAALPSPSAVAPSIPVAVAPAVAPASLLSAPQVLAASLPQPSPAQELEPAAAAAPETAAPSDDMTDDASGVPAVAPLLPSEVTTPVTTDTTLVPQASAPNHMRPRRHGAVSRVAKGGAHAMTPPAFFVPLPAVASAGGERQAARPEVEAVAAPTGAGRRIPRRAPPPDRVPPDGPDIGAAATSHGSEQPPSSPTSLLALLVFLVPGFAQWLWARAEPRPRALPAGRPERPG